MTAAVYPSNASNGCPFLLDTTNGPSFCPVTSHRPAAVAARPARAPTDHPNFRQNGNADLLYLPPLLSQLPVELGKNTHSGQLLAAATTNTAFSFDKPTVGYTATRLPVVDEASVALHWALHKFKPTSPDYAYEEYSNSFNWDEIELPVDLEREWYVVAFRSTRAANSPSLDLYEADRNAHEEAVAAGGLLAYWYGAPNRHGSNLATCIWMSRQHAIKANSGPKHREAMLLAAEMYENYDLERYVLKKVKGTKNITVETWISGEVAF